jgi:hypothetical protein
MSSGQELWEIVLFRRLLLRSKQHVNCIASQAIALAASSIAAAKAGGSIANAYCTEEDLPAGFTREKLGAAAAPVRAAAVYVFAAFRPSRHFEALNGICRPEQTLRQPGCAAVSDGKPSRVVRRFRPCSGEVKKSAGRWPVRGRRPRAGSRSWCAHNRPASVAVNDVWLLWGRRPDDLKHRKPGWVAQNPNVRSA